MVCTYFRGSLDVAFSVRSRSSLASQISVSSGTCLISSTAIATTGAKMVAIRADSAPVSRDLPDLE